MREHDALTPWPTREAYDEAMLDWTHTLQDDELRQGQLQVDSFGIIRYGGAGLYVCVYRIDNWLVRCFRSNPPADIRERYMASERFCLEQAETCSALIPITYQPEGINVRGQLWPIVKMPFFQRTPSLGKYIERHHDDSARMHVLAAAWLRMIGEMEAAPLAHGDLDLTNVLVEERGDGPLLRLIDYDNLWIPALAQHKQTEYGHEHFQHPAFLPPHGRPYDAAMDRFSAIVMYLSLLALAHEPALYENWQADESAYLLLLRTDYQLADRPDGRVAYLRGIPGLAPYVDALRAALRAETMPPSLLSLATPPSTRQSFAPVPIVPAPRPHRVPVSLRPPLMRFPTTSAAANTTSVAAPASQHSQPPTGPVSGGWMPPAGSLVRRDSLPPAPTHQTVISDALASDGLFTSRRMATGGGAGPTSYPVMYTTSSFWDSLHDFALSAKIVLLIGVVIVLLAVLLSVFHV